MSFTNELKKIAKVDSKLVKVTYEELEIDDNERECFEKVTKLLNSKLGKFIGTDLGEEEGESTKVSSLFNINYYLVWTLEKTFFKHI